MSEVTRQRRWRELIAASTSTRDNAASLAELSALAGFDTDQERAVAGQAAAWIEALRHRESQRWEDKLLRAYALDQPEGLALMRLAEALPRIPDRDTARALIRDCLPGHHWHRRGWPTAPIGAGLAAASHLVAPGDASRWRRALDRLAMPAVQAALRVAVDQLGLHFVLARDMDAALDRARPWIRRGYGFSFDMLGEAALTEADTHQYHNGYLEALNAVAAMPYGGELEPAISIRLSALHPRCEASQSGRVRDELVIRFTELALLARSLDVSITIDAEEQDRLELCLAVFEQVVRDPRLRGWGGVGLAVQAYGRRALPTLRWLAALAESEGDCYPVRLVKGAYWDAEIKLAQQRGLAHYPVYTRKCDTDISYLGCARFMLTEARGHLSPRFATHNAHTLAAVLAMADNVPVEFQRLHGMGEALYDVIREQRFLPVRIYAPIGEHRDLLPYLLRRLLENGANNAFVRQVSDPAVTPSSLTVHPLHQVSQRPLPAPTALFADRPGSLGVALTWEQGWRTLHAAVAARRDTGAQAAPWIAGAERRTDTVREIRAPQDPRQLVGHVHVAGEDELAAAFQAAVEGAPRWAAVPVAERGAIVRRYAGLLETHRADLIALCQREAGKTWQDAVDEIREAVDFCRYYAARAEALLTAATTAPDPWGQRLRQTWSPLGVVACISPWNFPLAIFSGQIVAALLAGNSVLAKPAEQTPLIAARAVALLVEAGLPGAALQLLPGSAELGAALVRDPRIDGVVFTGSLEAARAIRAALPAQRCLIAETGGQNAMLVDSSALPEQVVRDVLRSAFGSAGQRCSSLRLLCLQEDIADAVVAMLEGAMAELQVGDPQLRETDVGPVIDSAAQRRLSHYINEHRRQGRLLAQSPLPEGLNGYFVAPSLVWLDSIAELTEEQFGPVLHLIRYRRAETDTLVDALNALGYGLTLGIHSRNLGWAQDLARRLRIGNVYINRDQIGAVVGVQPFGGRGLSGTGPKAGGPHYLPRLMVERWQPDTEQQP